ncbi:MAG TPA: hypothetical protein VNZ52_12050 [Candidatus Thermoplasmatota archaeon]|nr:hypothetical protein [Candidatus Thermoplasmatota archaeon]
MTQNPTLALALALLVASTPLLAGCLTEETPQAASAEPMDTADAAPRIDTGTGAPVAGRDAAPHVHDYWGGRDRVALLDQNVEIGAQDAAIWTLMSTFYTKEPMAGGFFASFPENTTVYEGTGLMEITLTWSEPTITGFKFTYRHAGSPDLQGWVPVQKDVPTVLEVTPDMTDMPHSTGSRWEFLFTATGTPAVAFGVVHVKIEIVRTRDPAVYAGHPDRWQGATTLPILEAEGVAAARGPPQQTQRMLLDPWAGPAGLLDAQAPVPMETGNLTVTVTIRSITPDHRAVDRLLLGYQTPDLSFNSYFLQDGATEVSEDRTTWTWRVPVEMDQTDSPYAETSGWSFFVRPVYASPAGDADPCREGCTVEELRYGITVVAERAPVT